MLEEIIDKISKLQSTGCTKYHAGLFPSQRVHAMTGYCREDSNIFFSALIAFTLKQLQRSIPDDWHPEVDQIIEKVRSNYHRYRHYADPDTYNFWQDHPNGHFPNGRLLKKVSLFALPADADDTSLIYLTSPPKNGLLEIKQKLESHYPRKAPISPLTPEAYVDLSPYPTFLGKKVKREFDVCVICNVLCLVFKHKLYLSATDYDSIMFVKRVLKRRDYRFNSFSVSPNYGNFAVILYHISRLVGSFRHPALEVLREPLIDCLELESEDSHAFMESLLIKISLLRLGVNTPPLAAPKDWEDTLRNFYFFQAGMLTGFQKASLNNLAGRSFFHLKYRCEAYYWTLWLEYKVLANSVQLAKG